MKHSQNNGGDLGSNVFHQRLGRRNAACERMLQQYASGLVRLPLSIRNQIALVKDKNRFQDVGAEFAQKLERYKPWQALVARNPGLTPYSLRHGYAWRAHCCSANPLHPRNAAAFMGHNVQTHLKHYGSWTDEASLDAALERFNQGVNA